MDGMAALQTWQLEKGEKAIVEQSDFTDEQRKAWSMREALHRAADDKGCDPWQQHTATHCNTLQHTVT